MPSMKDRLRKVEDRMAAPDVARARMEEDAGEVTKQLFHSAASFSDADARLSPEDLLAMSPAQHCAWAIRFAPEQANPMAIMALHGHG